MPAPPEPAVPRPLGFAAAALAVAAKDLRVEWRSREIVTTMGFFALLVVLVFSFAFVPGDDSRLQPAVSAGILWITVLFAGVVALARTFDRERDGEAVRALLLSPAPRGAIYLGKLSATAALMLLVEAPVGLLTALLLGARLAAHPGWVAGLVALGTLGFAAVGTVFSAGLLRAKSRDVLLSSLLFPVVLPLLMVGVRATSQLLDVATPDTAAVVFWTEFLAGMDVLLIGVGLWSFEPVVTGE